MEDMIDLAGKILKVRLSQMIINEKYKAGIFKIPLHLALGHETIAVAVSQIMGNDDHLILTHRNMHYNLARLGSLKDELHEYYLKEDGLARGELGSMNLANEKRNVGYTSSILGNNLPISAGFALGQKVKKSKGMVIVVTGDGAIEEGTFYESILFLKTYGLPCLILVENNQWSMATKIEERRCGIDLSPLMKAFNIRYERLDGNEPVEYVRKLGELRKYALDNDTPVCVEVMLTTLGSWYLKTPENPSGRFINYHAGPANTISLSDWPLIEESPGDPMHVLKKHIDESELRKMSKSTLEWLKEDIDEVQ